MECDCLPACPFFHDRMRNMPTMAEVLKQRFCREDPESCARCLVVRQLGPESVPPDLFPDETERARAIVEAVLYHALSAGRPRR